MKSGGHGPLKRDVPPGLEWIRDARIPEQAGTFARLAVYQ
jgi:hypothetical protein